MAADGAGDAGNDDGPNVLLIVVAVLVGVPIMLTALVIGAAVVGAFVLGFGGGMEGASAPPSVEWEASTDADRGTATFTHGGGETVYRGDLIATVNGERAPDLEAADGTIEEGDTVTVHGVEPGDEVRLLWTAGDDRQLIATHTA